jgi:hypothetical protein
MLRTHTARATCAALALAATASTALAQLAPPQPSKDGTYNPIIGYAVLAVLGGIVIAISLYPSKRSHQDV